MAKYEGSAEDMREDARGQKRMDAKKHKKHRAAPPPFGLSTPPGGANPPAEGRMPAPQMSPDEEEMA